MVFRKYSIAVVIPCYNEVNTIEQVLLNIQRASVTVDEIIVVDDGSTDGSCEFLHKNKETFNLKVFFHKKNKGKGAALKTGFQHVISDIVIIQDADLEYSPKDYPQLIAPICDEKADVVYGSRFVGGQEHRILYFWHYKANQFLTFLSNMFTNLNLTDIETCYKVFKRDVIKSLDIKEKRFGVEPEITAKIAKLNCRIYEVGISYQGRTYNEGKKIGFKDAFRAIWCIIKYNLC